MSNLKVIKEQSFDMSQIENIVQDNLEILCNCYLMNWFNHLSNFRILKILEAAKSDAIIKKDIADDTAKVDKVDATIKKDNIDAIARVDTTDAIAPVAKIDTIAEVDKIDDTIEDLTKEVTAESKDKRLDGRNKL